jgi:hypothetical protein
VQAAHGGLAHPAGPARDDRRAPTDLHTGSPTRVKLVLLPGPGAGTLYGVTDPADLAWMEERLTAHPWKCFEQPLKLTNEAAFNALPQYHIVCTSTLATRDEDLMRQARKAGRLWDIDTGHDLMITEPQAVTDALIEIASTTR